MGWHGSKVHHGSGAQLKVGYILICKSGGFVRRSLKPVVPRPARTTESYTG
jgi:hypothetical protein